MWRRREGQIRVPGQFESAYQSQAATMKTWVAGIDYCLFAEPPELELACKDNPQPTVMTVQGKINVSSG